MNFLVFSLQQKVLTWIFVLLTCWFFVLYVGMEVSYGLFVATFAVESQLNLSKSDGAYVTAIFWGSFAAMRFVAIFLAVKMKPIYIMLISFGFCFVGAVPLVIWGDTSPMILKVKRATDVFFSKMAEKWVFLFIFVLFTSQMPKAQIP